MVATKKPSSLITEARIALKNAIPGYFERLHFAVEEVNGTLEALEKRKDQDAIRRGHEAISMLNCCVTQDFPIRQQVDEDLVKEALEKLNTAIRQLDPDSLIDK